MAKQRIIAITGASGGLAQEIVKQLSLSDGIILLGRDKDKLEKCYRHVKNKTCLAIDLRDDNAIKEMVDYLYQRFGRIDVFINCVFCANKKTLHSGSRRICTCTRTIYKQFA